MLHNCGHTSLHSKHSKLIKVANSGKGSSKYSLYPIILPVSPNFLQPNRAHDLNSNFLPWPIKSSGLNGELDNWAGKIICRQINQFER